MDIIRKIREEKGLSQRNLADKSGVSFRCLQQLESRDHNWRISSVRYVAHALGLPESGLDYSLNRYFSIQPDSVDDISLRILQDGFDSWQTHLFNFVDRFRASSDPLLVHSPPVKDLDPRLKALVASTVERLCEELTVSPPDWRKGIGPLPNPWFVAGIENLKAMALVESPATFRARNIFVLDNFLSRA